MLIARKWFLVATCLGLGLVVGQASLMAVLPPVDLTIPEQTFPAGSTTSTALSTVTTVGTVTVPTTAQVAFHAGTSITLSAGFSVQAGGTFSASVHDIDSDGDGITDIVEVAAGLNPDDPTDLARFNQRILSGIGWSTSASSPSAPLWWRERGVVSANSVADDYAAINQGQVKNLAKQAYETLKATGLINETSDAASPLVTRWSNPSLTGDNYAAANIGQIKAVAAPFYQHLYDRGFLAQLPAWLASPSPTVDNYVLANAGQLKNLFGFDLSGMASLSSGQVDYRNLIEGVPAAAWRVSYQSKRSTAASGTAVTEWADERGLAPLRPVNPTAQAKPLWIQAEGSERAVALSGSAAADYLKTGTLPLGTSISTSFSVMLVLRPTGLNTALPSFEFSVGEPASLRIWADSTTANKLNVSTAAGGLLDNCPPGLLVMNQWQYWVLVFDQGTGRLYKNGELVATRTGLVAPTLWMDLRVGRNSSVWLAELSIVAQSLDATQVAAYGEVIQTRYSGLALSPTSPATPASRVQLTVPSGTANTSQLNGVPVNVTISSPAAGASL